jgi:hypothetical protein
MLTATSIHPYLARRGFSAATVEACGWRIDRLTEDDSDKFPTGAIGCEVWRIPYPERPGRPEFVRVRFIHRDEADEWHKYRQPFNVDLDLYDPFGFLDLSPSGVLLIEGEANAAAVHEALPSQPVIGLPGISALKPALAVRLGGVANVVLWLDRDESDERKAKLAEQARQRAAGRLYEAGVKTVRAVGATGGQDANDVLLTHGREGAATAIRGLSGSLEPIPRPEPQPQPMARPRRFGPPNAFDEAVDGLRAIPAETYLTKLYNIEFRNGFGLCPWHDERTPSLHAGGKQNEAVYFCQGCSRGGDVFTAAGELWGIDSRDRDGFKELVGMLSAVFLGRVPA